MARGNSLNRALTRNWNIKPSETTNPKENEVQFLTVSNADDLHDPVRNGKNSIRFFQVPPVAAPSPRSSNVKPRSPSPSPKENTVKPSKDNKSDTVEVDTNEGTIRKGKRSIEGDDSAERRKKLPSTARKTSLVTKPTVRLTDVGGVEACIEEILEQIAMPLLHPEVYLHTGVQPPRGILLHGPPGCGKTLLANAIAGELDVPLLQISAPSVVSGMSGESEKKIRDVFAEARTMAPCLLFIDEIDAITPKRETAQREMERRIVAQLLTCMDDLSWDKTDYKPVLIIGATNRADALDPALRRAGRFDREICMTVPDETARENILNVLCAKLRVAGDFDFRDLARKTPGYVGADLSALTSAAGMIAVKRIFQLFRTRSLTSDTKANGDNKCEDDTEAHQAMLIDEEASPAQISNLGGTSSTSPHQESDKSYSKLVPSESNTVSGMGSSTDNAVDTIAAFLKSHPEPLSESELASLFITPEDFLEALHKVQPSSKREGFATVPGVSWDDIGALSRVRDELRMAIVEPIRHPDYFARVGITAPAGVLLWGPPGCGKTLLAKAVANESHTNFISVKGPELLNKYVGESERAVRQVFARAKASSPCVVFFDELDALCGRRDENQSEASARVVNTLLTELDGMETRKQVFIIAATNRPDMIDPAMLRPGRLDKLLYVELPTAAERLDILTTITRKTPLHPTDMDLSAVAQHPACDGLSGADLASLVREAAVSALRETIYDSTRPLSGTRSQDGKDEVDVTHQDIWVSQRHFQLAFDKVSPSVSKQDRANYERLRRKFSL
ncbi:Ribosome biogenesis ATPase rix7 [Dispira simplex]|nr:Ribosome biogenesis ATPase rix7 [Dispira simplex]